MPRGLADIDAAELEHLTPEERAEFTRLYASLVGPEGLEDFIKRLWPDEAPLPHLMPIIRTIERARTERLKVCISLPPRHGKTKTLERGVAWWLKNWPADTCAYTTYSDRKAWSKSLKFREAAIKAGITPAKPNSGQEWRTKEGGGLLAAGAAGGLTGEGIHGLMLVDDPFKNAADASSTIIRDKVWDWFTSVVMTRLEGASVIVVHTRWHEDDLIGRLEEQGGWEIINIKALAEDADDSLGRQSGEALWERRFSRAYLETLRLELGEYTFSALYQGRPIAKGARIFGDATYYDPHKLDTTGATASIGADPATGERIGLDYSVASAMAIKYDKDRLPWVYMLDVERSIMTIPTFAKFLLAFQKENWNTPVNLETVGAFKAVAQIMKESENDILLNELQGADLEGSKFLRCQRFAAAWNAGRVLLPLCIPPWHKNYNPLKPYTPVPWVKDFLYEFSKFTGMGDAHDDQVDACSHAFNAVVKLVKNPARGSYSDPGRYGVR